MQTYVVEQGKKWELGDLKNAPPKISQRRISVNSSTKGYFLFQHSQSFPNNDISLASIYEDLSFCRNKRFWNVTKEEILHKRGDSIRELLSQLTKELIIKTNQS